MPGMLVGTQCQKPTCTKEASDTYRGENGNSLHLCERHYYNLVSKSNGTDDTVPLSIDTPTIPTNTTTTNTFHDLRGMDDRIGDF